MRLFYFDTSALFKRYKPEVGTENIDIIFSYIYSHNDNLVTSVFTIVEFASAGDRLVKMKSLSKSTYQNLFQALAEDAEKYINFISMDDDIILSAAEAVRNHSLRPGDAIQYVSLNRIRNTMKNDEVEVIFVAADEYLCQTTSSNGITTLNPMIISADDLKQYFDEYT